MSPRITFRSSFLAVLVSLTACSGDDTGPLTPEEDPEETEVAVLSFDGVDDYVEVADDAVLDLTDEVTLVAWVYFDGGLTGEPGIVQKDGPSSFGRYGLWVLGDKVDFCVYIAGGSQECMYSAEGLASGAWNHVAGVYDGSAMRLYLNGELDSSVDVAGEISTSSEPLYIGGDPTESRYYLGHLRDVQVWSTARTASEIAAAVDARPTGDEAGLVGYWPLDEGSGQSVRDATGNGLEGRLGASGGVDASDPSWETVARPD